MSENAPKNHRKGHTCEMNGERIWIGKGGSSTQGDKEGGRNPTYILVEKVIIHW